ncbi:hypothetical protein ACRAWF_15145 [Streptomyces sp. L7]
MTCEQETTELAAYAMAALDPGETARVGRHLRACPGLRGRGGRDPHRAGRRPAAARRGTAGRLVRKTRRTAETAVRAALAEDPPVPRPRDPARARSLSVSFPAPVLRGAVEESGHQAVGKRPLPRFPRSEFNESVRRAGPRRTGGTWQ